MDALELMPVRVRITSILKKAIYTGEYHSGDELSLSDVAARLGVSRTPVREAFQALEAEGLITLRMNRGAIVNQIDRKFIADIFDMRMLLESEAAARAATNGMETAALLERLHDLRDHLEALDRADVILAVVDGRIVEQGTHEALMKKRGYYFELYTRQYIDIMTGAGP